MVALTAYPQPIQKPTQAFQFVDGKGALTELGMSTLLGMWGQINGANLIIPCTCDQTSTNLLALTPLIQSPKQQQSNVQVGVYTVFTTYAFVAQKTSTGTVTASVAPLGVLGVVKGNSSAVAGDIIINDQYFLTYVDTYFGTGGFALR